MKTCLLCTCEHGDEVESCTFCGESTWSASTPATEPPEPAVESKPKAKKAK